MTQEVKKVLGIDWGEKRIGLATADTETKIATPLKVVNNIKEVFEIAKEEEVDKIIIGLPIKMDQKKSKSSREAGNFIKELRLNLDIPIETIDERLTSKAVDALVGDKKTKASRDAMAAMLILQTYLDRLG